MSSYVGLGFYAVWVILDFCLLGWVSLGSVGLGLVILRWVSLGY
jgi:hypothetical protein